MSSAVHNRLGLWKIIVFSAYFLTICSSKSAEIVLPDLPIGRPVYFLAANSKTQAERIGLNGVTATLPGEIVQHDVDAVVLTDEKSVLLKKEGYKASSVTFKFPTNGSVTSGEYAIWTCFNQGGDSSQSFNVELVKGDSTIDVLEFRQSAKSWETQWRQALGTVTVYPGDEAIQIKMQGKASQQKSIAGFILVQAEPLHSAITADDVVSRKAVRNLYRSEKPRYRLQILEPTGCALAQPFYEALAKTPTLSEQIAFENTLPSDAQKLASSLNITGAAYALLIDKESRAIRQLWKGPFTATGMSGIVGALGHPDSITQIKSQPMPLQSVATCRMTDGCPKSWLTVGPWAGPGGLSLWGLDYEPRIRPSLNSPDIITCFDEVRSTKWEALEINADGTFSFPLLNSDYMWSRGTSYAHLYIESEKEQSIFMELTQNGTESIAWLNGERLTSRTMWSHKANRPNSALEKRDGSVIDKNDQGGQVETKALSAEVPQSYSMTLKPGWNHLVVKLIFQLRKGERLTYQTQFTNLNGEILKDIRTACSDPVSAKAPRELASSYIPVVQTDAPFNLVDDGKPVVINVSLGRNFYKERKPAPYLPFDGVLELSVADYDGRELMRKSVKGTFPSDISFTMEKSPGPGYYATHLRLLDEAGNLVVEYPPDGFNVIRGTSSQSARRAEKKMAVTYYFMTDRPYKTFYFPYMQRIGIFRNIGGTNGKALDFFKEAHAQGLNVAADTWNHRDPSYLDEYIKETFPYVDSFKAFNEIDIVPAQRGTPESWVKKIKLDYETVKKYAPKAIFIGGSLVRPAADKWFEDCLKLGLDKYQDVWDVHCYPKTAPKLGGSLSNSPDETELGVVKTYERLGLKNTKPFWIGETGARCSHGMDARRWQAAMVAKMAACALSREDFQKIGFLVPWWYSRTKGELGDIETGHMPGESAYYTASALIDGFPYTRLKLGPAIQAAQFGPTMMLWREEGTSQLSIQLELSKEYVVVDVIGRVTFLKLNEKGQALVALTASPVYVLLRSDYDKLTAF